MKDEVDVVVVGAGQAGLAVSYMLSRSEVDHIVLERGEVGESWRSQRWDSFCLNTPNWCNGLPGLELDPDRPEAFSHRDRFVTYFEEYVQSFDLPVQAGTTVTRVAKSDDGRLVVETDKGEMTARAVVLASGSMSRPRMPAIAERLDKSIKSLSAGTYRSPAALPDGAVVVVGTGQSGCQIAEDVLADGRATYVCASRVARVPRVYRGRDIVAWWADMGVLEVRLDELDDPGIQFATQPQVSGTDGGHTVSLQSLRRDGATLLGRASDVDGYVLELETNLMECISFADERARMFKEAVDDYIDRNGIVAPPPEPDPGEPPLPDLHGSDLLERLDLRAAGVGSFVWCTGFDADWSWVDVDVFDDDGRPRHHDGIADTKGLYFVGFPWLSKRKSGIVYGVSEDSERIVRHIETNVLGPA